MKKILFILAVSLIAFAVVGCDGSLHNTPASFVNFEVRNFPAADGTYNIAGNFPEDTWDNGARTFEIVDGEGTYEGDDMIISSDLPFSITDEDDWDRSWLGDFLGTDGFDDDNFEAVVPMDGAVHTIIIDFDEAGEDGVLEMGSGLSVVQE